MATMARNAVYPGPLPLLFYYERRIIFFFFFFIKINKSDSGGEGGREFRYSMYGYKFGAEEEGGG